MEPRYAHAKDLSYGQGDLAKKSKFLRIHHLIPTIGTDFESSNLRAEQTAPSPETTELSAFIHSASKAFPVLPRLLGFQKGKQGDNDVVPRGFLTFVVWNKVMGNSLSADHFSSLSLQPRDAIRRKFRRVFGDDTAIMRDLATYSKLNQVNLRRSHRSDEDLRIQDLRAALSTLAPRGQTRIPSSSDWQKPIRGQTGSFMRMTESIEQPSDRAGS
ncbi:Uncharacterized protein PECH_007860 [Penicillium ucsense]|uniref:Uncharacterized protein n=1 Tax=Penicillium ucsense TaxID=2839758 RepID=A0A8J8W089_9EURO|nr:Uncharacterized protein PECM_007713 [Penicillium ucsense]KAF7734584.1 Uncharacterized protein PECH_007860 [Penicillium ucsense]